MEVLEQNMIKNIIENALEKSISYTAYRDLVKQLVEDNSTTGNDKSEAMANYTMLNDRRMKRWDKTVKVSDEAEEEISNFKTKVTWLVLTESWCGDAAHIIPVLHKIAELNDNIDLKLVFRDENEALMDEFLTNGGQAIPKLIMIDDTTGNVLSSYGPRPYKATKLVQDYKKEFGELSPEFKEDLQHWYNKDKGQSVIKDMIGILKG